MRGRPRPSLRCGAHPPWPALRARAPCPFILAPFGARPPAPLIPRPAGSLAGMNCRARAIPRFAQNPAAVSGGLSDSGVHGSWLRAGLPALLTCGTATRQCARCIDAGPSRNGRPGGRLAGPPAPRLVRRSQSVCGWIPYGGIRLRPLWASTRQNYRTLLPSLFCMGRCPLPVNPENGGWQARISKGPEPVLYFAR